MLIEELAADTVAGWRAHSGSRVSTYRERTDADRHECQEGNEVKGINTRPRALTNRTLTNLERMYERRATDKAITEMEGTICNHSYLNET